MLEVYYRYLPIYQEMEKKSLPPMPVPVPGQPAPVKRSPKRQLLSVHKVAGTFFRSTVSHEA